jgi:hypothetical protein
MVATAGLSLTLDPMGKMFQNASSLKPLGQLKQTKKTKLKHNLPGTGKINLKQQKLITFLSRQKS